MLSQLSIRDIVLIERLDVEFAPGLAILTGETGAGKSILLDALTLALGARGDAGLVRQGATQGQVTAAFDVRADHPALTMLAENEIEADDSIILRRVQFADGRTRAFVNDQQVSVTVLRSLGAMLVEIHGQHDDRALVDPVTHRRLVDAFGGLEGEVETIRCLWAARREARQSLDLHRARMRDAEREGDWLRHAVEELGGLRPAAGEEAALSSRRTAMMQGEKIVADLQDAYAAVSGPQAPTTGLAAAVRRLERRQAQAEELIEPAVRAIDAALGSIEEARMHLEAAIASANYDPSELERIEERLFSLRAAARKYNVSADDLSALCDRYATDLAALDAGAESVAALEREAAEADRRYAEAAERLSEKRRAAAAKLDSAVKRELAPLRLERARFFTEIASDASDDGPEGRDRVEFWAQTNPSTRPGALIKVASGGELARFLLALKVVLADRGSAPTLVFDEIDAGVGGAVADAIGARLARLAQRVQVVAVTHAPQVAARATRHYLISKDTPSRGRRVATAVTELASEHRREEIARMLAGAEVTDEARAAAERLIQAGAA